MPGMLQEGQIPSSGPSSQTPPSQGGNPLGEAAGPERSAPTNPQDFESLRDQAIQLVYGERFDQLIEMFQTNGAENFPRSMAIAVNTAITELEKQGKMDYQMATRVGLEIYMRLLADMVGEGVVEGLTPEKISEALPATLIMYADSHPEVTKEDIQGVVLAAQQGIEEQGAEARHVPEIDDASTIMVDEKPAAKSGNKSSGGA